MGAQILDRVAQTRQKGRQLLLQVQPRMIGRQRQVHAARLLYFRAYAQHEPVHLCWLVRMPAGGADHHRPWAAGRPGATGAGAAAAGAGAGHAAGRADADVPRQRRPDHHRSHRPRQPRPVHRRPEAGRDRGLRRRRQAGHRVAGADSRRARLQRAGPAAGAGAGRHHPAAQPAHQRHRRARVPAVHRRPAPGLPRDAAHARPAEADAEEPDSRRRHVRHRDHGHLVDLAAADLRPPGARLGDLAHHRQLAEAVGNHPGRAGSERPDRAATPRARRVFDGLRSDAQPREAAEPPQGRALHQQRLRLQSVRAGPRGRDGQADARGKRQRAAKRSVLPQPAEPADAGRIGSRFASWPS